MQKDERKNKKRKGIIFFKAAIEGKKNPTQQKKKGKRRTLSLEKEEKKNPQIQGSHDMHDSQGNTKLESLAITLSQPLKESWRVCPQL